jgi:gamma-glutamyltranspeptidase
MSSRRVSRSTGRTSSRKLKNGTNTERYLLPHGKPAVAGDVIHQPELGQTLRAIAKDGRDAFYKGAIAEDMVETLRGIGGLHTLEDFAAHTTETTVADRHHVQGPRRLAVPAERARASPCW